MCSSAQERYCPEEAVNSFGELRTCAARISPDDCFYGKRKGGGYFVQLFLFTLWRTGHRFRVLAESELDEKGTRGTHCPLMGKRMSIGKLHLFKKAWSLLSYNPSDNCQT